MSDVRQNTVESIVRFARNLGENIPHGILTTALKLVSVQPVRECRSIKLADGATKLDSSLLFAIAELLLRYRVCMNTCGHILNSEPFYDFVKSLWFNHNSKANHRFNHEKNEKSAGARRMRGTKPKNMEAEFEYMVETAQAAFFQAVPRLTPLQPVSAEIINGVKRDKLRMTENWYNVRCGWSGQIYQIFLSDKQMRESGKDEPHTFADFLIQNNSENATPANRVFMIAEINNQADSVRVKNVVRVCGEPEPQVIKRTNHDWMCENLIVGIVGATVSRFFAIESTQARHLEPLALEHKQERGHRHQIRDETFVADFWEFAHTMPESVFIALDCGLNNELNTGEKVAEYNSRMVELMSRGKRTKKGWQVDNYKPISQATFFRVVERCREELVRKWNQQFED